MVLVSFGSGICLCREYERNFSTMMTMHTKCTHKEVQAGKLGKKYEKGQETLSWTVCWSPNEDEHGKQQIGKENTEWPPN